MRFDFPSGAVAEVFINLPPHLAPHHGAIIAIVGRPRLPSLEINQERHCILEVRGKTPRVGLGSLNVGGRTVAEGGQLWLSFESADEAEDFACGPLRRAGVPLI